MSAPEERPDRVALAEGLVLLVVALLCLGFQLWLPSTHVAEADYQAVAAALGAERQPGDVVLLAPWWTERARIYVPEGLPVVGYQGSDGEALEAHPRVWVLSEPRLPGAQLGAFERAFNPGRTALGPERRFGNLALQLFQNGRHRPSTFSAAALLEQAQVYLESPDGNRAGCAQAGGAAFRCPNGKPVGREVHEVHYAPYECVRLEAPANGQRQVVEFTAPAATASTLQAGFIWEYGAYRDGVSPAVVGLEVDGFSQAMTLPVGDESMHRLEGPPIKEGARVKLWLSAQNPNARVVCLRFTGWGSGP